MPALSLEDRYLNLAMINIGEALTELGNVRQRGHGPGPEYANVKLALRRAAFALDAAEFVPLPPDPKHKDEQVTLEQRIGAKE
jgi:hypothetical protein